MDPDPHNNDSSDVQSSDSDDSSSDDSSSDDSSSDDSSSDDSSSDDSSSDDSSSDDSSSDDSSSGHSSSDDSSFDDDSSSNDSSSDDSSSDDSSSDDSSSDDSSSDDSSSDDSSSDDSGSDDSDSSETPSPDNADALAAATEHADAEAGSDDVGAHTASCPSELGIVLTGGAREPGTKDLLPGGTDPPEPGNLEIIVLEDSNGNPIPGLTVRISAQNNPVKRDGPTNSGGKATFRTLPSDSYDTTAGGTGFIDKSIKASVAPGDLQNMSTETIRLQPSVLEIVDAKTGAVVSGGTQGDKIVGQKIQLTVRAKGGDPVANVQWTIPGETVKDYRQIEDRTFKTDLAQTDLQNDSVNFYWTSGGAKAVRVSGSVSGASQTAKLATFAVQAPTNVIMTSATGTARRFFFNHIRQLVLGFGDATPGQTQGITFTCQATAPAGGDGKIAGVQLANINRTVTDNQDKAVVLTSDGAFGLDTSVPYDVPKPIRAGAAATWIASDSPLGNLIPLRKKRAFQDKFRMFLMYRPNGADSIWVTLARLDWDFAAESNRTDDPAANKWSEPTGVSFTPNPSGSVSSELPVWSFNVKDLINKSP